MTEEQIIREAYNALLMCATSVEPRSPAGVSLKKALESIKKYLEGKKI